MTFVYKINKQQGFSIKPKTLVENTGIKQQSASSPHNLPRPFIDRLAVTIAVPSDADGHDMYASFWQTRNIPGVFADFKPRGSNKATCRLMLPCMTDAKKWPFYEVDFDGKSITKLRIEFIPVDLGFDGLVELHALLTTLVPNGWLYFIEHGKISRLDVAIDFPGLKLAQLLFLPKQSATTKEWAQNGAMTGFQIGKKNGSHIQIYDRGAKRQAKKQSSAGKKGVRIECRKRYLQMSLSSLHKLACPFEKFLPVKAYPSCPRFEKKRYLWQFFKDSVAQRGAPAALALLPQAKRTKYRAYLKQNAIRQWDLEAIWSEWPKVLNDLEIADPHAWN